MKTLRRSVSAFTISVIFLSVILALGSAFFIAAIFRPKLSGYLLGVDNDKRLQIEHLSRENSDSADETSDSDGAQDEKIDTRIENVSDSRNTFDGGSTSSRELDFRTNFSVDVPPPEELYKKVDTEEGVQSTSEGFAPPVHAAAKDDVLMPDSKSIVESNDISKVKSMQTAISGNCDLYRGSWVYDSAGPLYRNDSCPVLSQAQNCQGNGRPDNEYENWRWKPSHCELPRFDAKKFLELMQGKTLAFVGDSVARNHMESLLCILWQVEVPKNRGNKKMHRWYFPSHSVMIVRVWSSWLVHTSQEAFDFAPAGIDKVYLDQPDETFMDSLVSFDVLVISSGHWFAKKSVYIRNNEIVGGQLWWPDPNIPKKIDSPQAFEISVESIVTSIATHPNYTGLTILRSYSPDHYEGGAWNTGGSCTGKVKPIAEGELVANGFTARMHEKQVTGFRNGMKKATSSKSKFRLMDITTMFEYRTDGHPGPYRSPDPNKKTKAGPDGRAPPQDCLHWCLPGPVDTWNEIILEVIRREYENSGLSSTVS